MDDPDELDPGREILLDLLFELLDQSLGETISTARSGGIVTVTLPRTASWVPISRRMNETSALRTRVVSRENTDSRDSAARIHPRLFCATMAAESSETSAATNWIKNSSSLLQLSVDQLVMPSIGHGQQFFGSHLGFRHHFGSFCRRDHRAHEPSSFFLVLKSTQYIRLAKFVAD